MLASPVFKKKLSGPWKESLNDPNSNMRHVETTDWDAHALLILLAILHGRTYQVPQNLDLEMLARIATLVDYYDCREAVQTYGDIWTGHLEESLFQKCNRELVLCIFVSWVFSNETIFNQTTRTATFDAKDPIPTLELPIPQRIIGCTNIGSDEIESRRRVGMAAICIQLQEIVFSLRKGSMGCDFVCSSMLLGALTKQMHDCNLLDLSPGSTCLGYGMAATAATLRAFRSPEWYTSRSRHMHACQLTDMIFSGIFTSFGTVDEGICLYDL
ncbi:hypothetical protein CKAH01_13152 [Colletotrichum kahawae]|uniref:BTB domain-containing protein n=1 Tax=Colletotrichum kahawae TaxID=34407 RepID=A0AAD9YP10_COLKA|nr:hypothetical protein CKAH01_13152 [Colletotrichum kahawae]